MPQCVTLNVDGTLTTTTDAVETCSGFVMVSAPEYSSFALVSSLFELPTPAVLVEVSTAAFFAPLVFYLVGLMVGRVAGFFK